MTARPLASITRIDPPPAADDRLKTYVEDFARLVPAEALAAYTSLVGILEVAARAGPPTGADPEALNPAGIGQAVVLTGWACLLAAAALRLATSHDPADPTARPQMLPALSAAIAFALWVYATGHHLGLDFGQTPATLAFWSSFLSAAWVALSPLIVPSLVRLLRRP